MKKFLIIVSVLLVNPAHAQSLEDKAFLQGWLESFGALTVGIDEDKDIVPERFELTLIPERKNLDLIGHRAFIPLDYFEAEGQRDHLVLLIPGLGSHLSGLTYEFAALMNRMGLNVAAIPSPSHWQFLAAANPSGIPGDVHSEVQGLRMILDEITRPSFLHVGRKYTRITIVGFSLGGVYTAALAQDLTRNPSSQYELFEAFLLNPPVNSVRSAKLLDKLYDVGERFSSRYRDIIVGRALNLVMDGFLGQDPMTLIQERFTFEELMYLVGYQFRLSLPENLFTLSLIHPELGILKRPYSKWRRNARMEEATHLDYEDMLYGPVLGEVYGGDLNRLEHEASLLYWLEGARNVHVIHTQNDPLVTADDFADLKTLPSLLVLERGGHLGYLLSEPFFELLNAKISR